MSSSEAGTSSSGEFDVSLFNLQMLHGNSDRHLKTLNKLLSKSRTARNGLELLDSVLNYATIENVSEYVIKWLDHCLRPSEKNLKEIRLKAIGKLIEISYFHNDISKKIASDYLSKIFELCVSSKGTKFETLSALIVLRISIKRYGNWFANHKFRIEKFIIGFLDCLNQSIVEKAAMCLLFLQQVGNAGSDGINHRKNYQETLQKLCATFHSLLDTFFENRINVDIMERPEIEGFNIGTLSSNSPNYIAGIVKRIKNVITFIKILIQEAFTVCKDISPMDVLNVVNRGTTVHHCVNDNDCKNDYQFFVNLNSIQVHLMHLLRVFILWLKNNSFPFTFLISKILIDCLKRSQNCKCFNKDIIYQETVYITLKTWITTTKTGINAHFQEELINCISKDITPARHSVTLKIQTDEERKKNRNKNKNIHVSNLILSRSFLKSEFVKHKNETKCHLALDILAAFFDSCYIRLDSSVISDINIFIISIINEIITSNIPHPYTNPRCQSNIYKVLVKFYEQNTTNVPNISLALNIFNINSSSKNSEVAEICRKGLKNLEKICQPIALPDDTSVSLPSEILRPTEGMLLECITDITQDSSDEDIDNDDDVIAVENSPSNESPPTVEEPENLKNEEYNNHSDIDDTSTESSQTTNESIITVVERKNFAFNKKYNNLKQNHSDNDDISIENSQTCDSPVTVVDATEFARKKSKKLRRNESDNDIIYENSKIIESPIVVFAEEYSNSDDLDIKRIKVDVEYQESIEEESPTEDEFPIDDEFDESNTFSNDIKPF